MNHELQDSVSLELARQVAVRLRRSPDALAVALENLDRWSRCNQDSPRLLRCYEEWRNILARPVEEICETLCNQSEDGQRLRQNSPFVGILSPREVWEIKSRLRHAKTPA